MNRQTSLVTARCQVTGDESESIQDTEVERRTLLANPTSYGDTPVRSLAQTTKPNPIVAKPCLSPDACGFYQMLPHGFRVDVVANGGIRIYNYNTKSAVYCSDNGDEVAVIGPYGRVHRYQDVVTGLVGDKIVKMSRRGVTFTSHGKPIVYLVDAAGCKSTTDKFKYLTGDITSQILLRRREVGEKGREKTLKLIQEIQRQVDSEGEIHQEIWHISNYVFTITPNGRLTVCKPDTRLFFAIDPDGGIKIKVDRMTMILRDGFTSFVKFSLVSLGFVEAESPAEQSVKIENSKLTAKCAYQRAGLDEKNQLVLSNAK